MLGSPLHELSAHTGFYAVVFQYALLLELGCCAGPHMPLQGLLGPTVLGHHALWLQHQTGTSFAFLISQDTPEGCRRQAAYTLANPQLQRMYDAFCSKIQASGQHAWSHNGYMSTGRSHQ